MLVLVVVLAAAVACSAAADGPVAGYFADWGLIGGRAAQPTCVDIPRNMSLCHGIGYSRMRLPNLLDHDTMGEVSQQSASWVPLQNIKCHPDTQLFLCSLFAPVCLDRPIYPCRSLCEKVRQGCEGRMRVYGYPWPDILKCEKFPLDNDMCITAQSEKASPEGGACSACNQVGTYENILDNFCRADFAVKTKIKKLKKSRIICKKSKVFKTSSHDRKEVQMIRRPTFVLDDLTDCCNGVGKDTKDHYLIMGNKKGTDLVPTFIMEWHAESMPFRNAVRMFKKLDCSDPKMVSESMLTDPVDGAFPPGGTPPTPSPAPAAQGGKSSRRETNEKSDRATRKRQRKGRGRNRTTTTAAPQQSEYS